MSAGLPSALRPCLVLAALLATPPSRGAQTLALWTFETSAPTTAGPHLPEEGGGAASGYHADLTATYSHPIGNGSAASFSANRWALGDYYEFRLSSIAYQDLTLSWDQGRSSTGPALFDLAYSTNGADFIVALDDYAVSATSFSSTTVKGDFAVLADLGQIQALNNAPELWFRLIAASAPGGTTGTSRVDNFRVVGETFVPPVNSLYWAPDGSGSAGTWDYATPNWSSQVASGIPPVRYDASHRAVIGAPGMNSVAKTLQISPTGVSSAGGIRFESGGYLVKGGPLTLDGQSAAVEVSHAQDTTTIESRVLGDSGLTKSGAGTLVLSGANEFSGPITIGDGVLSFAADSALGSSANLLLKGGTLSASASVDLGSREIGGKGTLIGADGSRLSTSGAVDFESLAIAGGEVEFRGPLARTGSLYLHEGVTLRTPTGLQLGAGGIVTLPGSRATGIDGTLDLAGATRPVVVADGQAGVDLVFTGMYSTSTGTGRYKLHKTGDGTLELQAEGLGSAGLRIGSTGSLASAVPGGKVRISSAAALGGSTLDLNYGTLEIAGIGGLPAPILTGDAPALVSVSLGGVEGGGGAVIMGGDIEFLGDLRLFKPSGATVDHTLEIQNHTIFGGGLQHTVAPASGTFSGLRLLGTGTLSVRNAYNDFADRLVVDGPTIEVDGSLEAPELQVLRGGLNGTTQPGAPGLQGHVTIGDGLPGTAIFSPGSSEATLRQNGVPGDRVGLLAMKSLTLLSDGVLQLDIDSDLGRIDQIYLSEGRMSITADARLELADWGTIALAKGLEFTIVDIPFELSVEGTFNQKVLVAGKNIFEILYTGGDGNDVALKVIPEPGNFLFLIASGAFLALGRPPRRGGETRRAASADAGRLKVGAECGKLAG